VVFVGKRRDGFVPVFFDDTREVETDDQPLVGVVLKAQWQTNTNKHSAY